MTNFEKIKGYSIEEMAEFIYFAEDGPDNWPYPCSHCNKCPCKYHSGEVPREYCLQGVVKWLNSKTESEDK